MNFSRVAVAVRSLRQSFVRTSGEPEPSHGLTTFAAGLLALLFCSPPLNGQPPNPAFPIGNISISAFPTMQAGIGPTLRWFIRLPDGESPTGFLFFIRQRQLTSGLVDHTAPVTQSGTMISALPLDPRGSEFELWAIRASPSAAYLLDTTFVSSYVPMVSVIIRSEDPYSLLPRTRADRPFQVDVTVNGLLDDAGAPNFLKSVNLFRFAQSYETNGTGADLDRIGATLISQSSIDTNGSMVLTCATNAIPGTDRTKVRGEERFSVYSKEGDVMPESLIESQFIQIWPVADGSISGITPGQLVGPQFPQITLTLHDLYPDSSTWAHVYKGPSRISATGTTLPGSSVILNSPVPENRVINLSGYGSVFDSDGLWTLEILTRTPFGTDRMAYVSFTVQGLGMTSEGWRQAHFGSTDDSGDGANLNDFDHDGIPNLIEFAFGLDPKQNSAGMLPAVQKVGNQRVISFAQPAGILGITWGAEWSPTMAQGTWSPVTDTGTAPLHVFGVTDSAVPSCFIRLKVTQP